MRRIHQLAVAASLAILVALAAAAGDGPKPASTAASLGFDGGLTCTVNVKDLDKAVAWYRDALGFDLVFKMPEIGFAEVQSPVANVSVGLGTNRPGTSPGATGGATLVWGTKDIDATRKALEARGVKFLGATETIPDVVKLAGFTDLDGNEMMLYQALAKAK